MTNTVTSLKTSCSRENIARLFARFASRYGTLWTNRLGSGVDWDTCIDDWYADLRRFEYAALVQAAKAALEMYITYPPTFGQFEELCKKYSGFLQFDDAFRMLTQRDFSHPIVKAMYESIGSWTLKNGKEAEVQAKAKEAYRSASADFTLQPERAWQQLQDFNAKRQAQLPALEQHKEERKAHYPLKERLAAYQEELKRVKSECAGIPYQEFDADKIKKTSRNFDYRVYAEYCKYLLSVPEEKTLTLPVEYMYDRHKLICRREQHDVLRAAGFNPEGRGDEENVSKRNNGPSRVYKNWNQDI